MFYEIKLKVEKENSKGEMKEVIEHFITDVGLFAEAEAKGMEQYNGCLLYTSTIPRDRTRYRMPSSA